MVLMVLVICSAAWFFPVDESMVHRLNGPPQNPTWAGKPERFLGHSKSGTPSPLLLPLLIDIHLSLLTIRWVAASRSFIGVGMHGFDDEIRISCC